MSNFYMRPSYCSKCGAKTPPIGTTSLCDDCYNGRIKCANCNGTGRETGECGHSHGYDMECPRCYGTGKTKP